MNVHLTDIYWADDCPRREETLTLELSGREGKITTPDRMRELIKDKLPELDYFNFSVDYYCSTVTELMELVGVKTLLEQSRENDAANLLIMWMDHEEFFRDEACARYAKLKQIVAEFRILDPSKNCRSISRLVNVLDCVDQIGASLVRGTLIQLDLYSRASNDSRYSMDYDSADFDLAKVKAMELTVVGFDYSDFQFRTEICADIISWVEEHPIFSGTQFDGMANFPSSRTWFECARKSAWMTWYAEEPETDED